MDTELRLLPTRQSQFAERQMRKIVHARRELYHRPKNGCYDPVTYFHVVDALLEVIPDEIFRADQFVEHLRETRPQLIWDAITVGRVLNNIAEDLSEANGRPYLMANRHWDGRRFSVQGVAEARRALLNLLNDLIPLAEAVVAEEQAGGIPKRLDSPLLHCPSVMKLG